MLLGICHTCDITQFLSGPGFSNWADPRVPLVVQGLIALFLGSYSHVGNSTCVSSRRGLPVQWDAYLSAKTTAATAEEQTGNHSQSSAYWHPSPHFGVCPSRRFSYAHPLLSSNTGHVGCMLLCDLIFLQYNRVFYI